jgi:hypothetical protein
MLSYCFLFFRQFLVPCFYGLLVLIYWGSICKVVQTMSLTCLIILIFGIENSLLPCRLFMAYHKSSYLAITILLLLTQFLKATVELVHSENDCDFQSMNLFKQIFQEVTYFSFTLFLVINLFSYVLIYTIMLMSGILAAKNILELYPEEEEQHHGEQTNSNIAQPPQEVRVPEGDQQVCSICLVRCLLT